MVWSNLFRFWVRGTNHRNLPIVIANQVIANGVFAVCTHRFNNCFRFRIRQELVDGWDPQLESGCSVSMPHAETS